MAVFLVLVVASMNGSTTLILGFWFDVLQRKMRPKMTKRMKVTCVIGALLLLITLPGLLIQFILKNMESLGQFLVLAPLIIDLTGMFVVLVIIRCLKETRNISEETRARKGYAIKMLTVCFAFWIVSLIAIILWGQVILLENARNGTAAYWIIPSMILEHTALFMIGFCILSLVDRNGGVINLYKNLFRGVPMPEGNKVSRTMSSAISGTVTASTAGSGSSNAPSQTTSGTSSVSPSMAPSVVQGESLLDDTNEEDSSKESESKPEKPMLGSTRSIGESASAKQSVQEEQHEPNVTSSISKSTPSSKSESSSS
jgi:hypothetical protein